MPAPEVPNTPTAPADGKKLALIVGVNRSTTYLSTLGDAESDAVTIRSVLQKDACKFTQAKLLVGEQATTSTILDEIMALIKQATAQDLILFYFIGHGQPVRNKEENVDVYIATHDFNPDNAIQDKHRYISFRRLRELLYNADDVGGVVIILDCCYSGRMITPPDNSGQVEVRINIRQIVDDYLGQAVKIPKDKLQVILTSTWHKQQAEERVLTSLLVPALQGHSGALDPSTGNVNIHSLFNYLQNHMTLDQLPNLEGKFAGKCILASYPDKSLQSLEQARKAQEDEYLQKLPTQVKEAVSEVLKPLLEHTDISSAQSFDRAVCTQASLDDLDMNEIHQLFQQDFFLKQYPELLDFPERESILALGLVRELYPTYGALLCFGKATQQWISSAITQCIAWKGKDRLENRFFEGNVLSQLEKSKTFLRQHLNFTQVITQQGSTNQYEIPIRVLEEALVNALVHRDYQQQNSFVQVQIFDDRIEITSPGEPPASASIESLGTEAVSHPRNYLVAKMFFLSDHIQHAGTGIFRMREQMEEVGLPPPAFTLSPSKMFKIVLYRPQKSKQATDRVGQQVAADYHLTQLLSKGGFAEVYLAEQLSVQRQVAIKVLQIQLSSNEHKNFLDEALALSSLVHPNIVQILNFFIQDNTAMLVMEYAPNGSLRTHHSPNQPLSPAIVVSYVKQIASALQYAHDQHRLHLNIKPTNMLVGPRREIMLTDFHLALEANTERLSQGSILGTAAYVAPEQLSGTPFAASDQYALGVVVYEWLTGSRPFAGSSTAMALQHLSASPSPMKDIPAPIEQVVMKTLAKNPNDRFPTVLEFADALEQAFEVTWSQNSLERSIRPASPQNFSDQSILAPRQTTQDMPSVVVEPQPSIQPAPPPRLTEDTKLAPNTPPLPPGYEYNFLPRTSPISRRNSLFETDPGYLRVRKYSSFRTTGVVLNILSSFIVGLWQQSLVIGTGCLVASCLLFLLCILLVRRSVALSVAILLSFYWGIVGWASATVALSALDRNWLPVPAITSLLFFVISLYFHGMYVRNKNLL